MQTLNLSAYKGDTWGGFSMSISMNSQPVDFTDAVLRMQLRKSACSNADPAIEFSNDADATYSITTTSISSFRIDPAIINIASNDYAYDFQITFANSTILTPFGGTFTIIQDVTRD